MMRLATILGGHHGKTREPWGPVWPFLLGIGIFSAGIICGYQVPVGTHCDAAFSPYQKTALTQDYRQAFSLRETDYQSACETSAAQWSVLWWALIALGVVVFFLGFALWNRARRIVPVPVAAPQAQGVAAELALLAQLRDQGVVTQDELEEQKATLLGG